MGSLWPPPQRDVHTTCTLPRQFSSKDVAVALGYSNPRDALAKHVDDEDKNTVVIRDGNKGNPNVTVINESGLYSQMVPQYRGKSGREAPKKPEQTGCAGEGT